MCSVQLNGRSMKELISCVREPTSEVAYGGTCANGHTQAVKRPPQPMKPKVANQAPSTVQRDGVSTATAEVIKGERLDFDIHIWARFIDILTGPRWRRKMPRSTLHRPKTESSVGLLVAHDKVSNHVKQEVPMMHSRETRTRSPVEFLKHRTQCQKERPQFGTSSGSEDGGGIVCSSHYETDGLRACMKRVASDTSLTFLSERHQRSAAPSPTSIDESHHSSCSTGSTCTGQNPNDDPCYFPLITQHLVMTTAQDILEQACFEFVGRNLPGLTMENNWECGSSLELPRWLSIITDRCWRAILEPQLAFSLTPEVVRDLGAIRDTVVYRTRTTARGIKLLLESAVAFLEATKDSSRLKRMKDIFEEVEMEVRHMEAEFQCANKVLNMQLKELRKTKRNIVMSWIENQSDIKTEAGKRLREKLMKRDAATKTRTVRTDEPSPGCGSKSRPEYTPLDQSLI
ncbi:uncharacterized protein F5Z01DRAFT_754380 [Emericellopsis atlantica]|uniref:Uncharacterized protein n=1 Tax=Emericellopsis atlantica TaxID=2614577 RepID=A0A9P7ZDI2_9HYPO|nr:uncharacterized protein F5Z01DRAFT_754380 [Emericellopsis atlantica]KAG9249575.1 hypothetical protein F5Z01DRAFT_754380 [Emericellopsis atlantica]